MEQLNYDNVSKGYDTLYNTELFLREDKGLSNYLIELFGKELHSILDLGCGTGLGVKLTGATPKQYLGVDISKGLLNEAEKNYTNYKFLQSRITELPNSYVFDTIVAFYGVMNYLTDNEVNEIIKRGKRFFLMDYIDNYHPICYPVNKFPTRQFSPELFKEYFIGQFNNYNIYAK